VTVRERADATSLRVRRYRMMGLPRCPHVSTLAGTKVWVCKQEQWEAKKAEGTEQQSKRKQKILRWHADIRLAMHRQNAQAKYSARIQHMSTISTSTKEVEQGV
jgi:hypothetical protein